MYKKKGFMFYDSTYVYTFISCKKCVICAKACVYYNLFGVYNIYLMYAQRDWNVIFWFYF